MSMKIVIFLFFLNIFYSFSQSAHSIKIGTEIPLQYSIMYEQKIKENITSNIQLGILTKPYDKIILSILQSLGTDKAIIKMIEDAFSFGNLISAGVNYHKNKNYVGFFSQYINLKAGTSSTEMLENYFQLDINDFIQIDGGQLNKITYKGQELEFIIPIKLKSELYQIGFLYGRRFPLTEHFEICSEFALSKTFYSRNTLYIFNSQSPLIINNIIDSELKQVYLKYSFIPTLNLRCSYFF